MAINPNELSYKSGPNRRRLCEQSSTGDRTISQKFVLAFTIIVACGMLLFFQRNLQSQTTSSDDSNAAPQLTSTAIDPNGLVLQAIEHSVWGPSFTCQIRQRTKLYETEMVGVGQYWHAGEGTGKLEMYVRYAMSDSISNLIQVSDGRLMWTSTRPNEPLRKVHLDRVRQSFSNLGRGSNRPDVALYLSIGGQPEVLRMLYLRYRWYKAYAGTYKDIPVWQLIGTLRTQPPSISTAAPVDAVSLRQDPPKQTPTDVRLTLGREGEFRSFPFQIEYFIQNEGKDKQMRLVPLSTIEYYDFHTNIDTSKLFRYEVQNDVDQIEDETALYLPPTQITRSKGRTVR